MTLYETLAQRFIDDIKRKRLPAGSRLPAIRVMAEQNQVSRTTAIKTYDYLQQAGWIYALPQSGFYVANESSFAAPAQSYSLPIESRSPKQFAKEFGYTLQKEFFSPLGTSQIAPALMPETALQRAIKRVTHRSTSPLFHYPDPQGETLLRQALSEHFRRDHFIFNKEELVIMHSCLDAVRNAVETVTEVGDCIAVCSPCFSGLLDLLATLDRNIIEIPINQSGIDLVALEACMSQGKVRAALLSTTNINPLGLTLPSEDKQALAKLASTYQIPVIEDDIYLELSPQRRLVQPAKHWDKDGFIIWCSSISKTLAPGLRLGWCLPGRYFSKYLQRQALTSLGINNLAQASISEFINTGEYRSHLNKIRVVLQNQLHLYRGYLLRHLPENSHITQPDGGIVLWLKVPGLSATLLEKQAKSQNIDIRSGACFTTHEIYQDCLRINCGWPLTETREQLRELCQLIQKQLNRI
ncbi:MAG: PLP-dependent aminotransferase family protein [Aestuariibacter sp.]